MTRLFTPYRLRHPDQEDSAMGNRDKQRKEPKKPKQPKKPTP